MAPKTTKQPKPKQQDILYVIHGLSGAGKSTVASQLEWHGVPQLHPIAPYKRFLEECFKLEPGALDTPDGKAHRPRGCNGTMLDILVSSYHNFAGVAPTFSSHMLESMLRQTFADHRSASVQSIRNFAEVATIDRIRQELNLKVVLVHIARDSAQRLTSDMLSGQITQRILMMASDTINLINNGSLEELKSQVDKLIVSPTVPAVATVADEV